MSWFSCRQLHSRSILNNAHTTSFNYRCPFTLNWRSKCTNIIRGSLNRPKYLYKAISNEQENKKEKTRYQYRKRSSYVNFVGLFGIPCFAFIAEVQCQDDDDNDNDNDNDVPNDKNTEMSIIKSDVETYTSDNKNTQNVMDISKAKELSLKLLEQRMQEVGAPGLSIQVTVDGKDVWSKGVGLADVENNVPCSSHTVMRIASISKSLTMTVVAKLWEDGLLDLDVPIQQYLPEFPSKTVDGEEVIITTRQLLCHQSGIRHYELKKLNTNGDEKDKSDLEISDKLEKSDSDKIEKLEKLDSNKIDRPKEELSATDSKSTEIDDEKMMLKASKRQLRRVLNKARRSKKPKKKKESEFDLEEYYIKEEFSSVKEALEIFQHDPLLFKPGSSFLYTTHGWTLVSAIVESVSEKTFPHIMTQLFHDLGLHDTTLDKSGPIIYHRAKYYRRVDGVLKNAPYVDNSYKWAGGGFLSTVTDLVKFGNVMMAAYQLGDNTDGPPGILKKSTVEKMWKTCQSTKVWDTDGGYGLGWGTVEENQKFAFGHRSRHYVSHTGGAIGASSVLLVLPSTSMKSDYPPKGVVVAIICNMESVGLNKVALKIAHLFESASNK